MEHAAHNAQWRPPLLAKHLPPPWMADVLHTLLAGCVRFNRGQPPHGYRNYQLALSDQPGTVLAMKFIRKYDESWVDDFNDIARFLGTYLPDEMLIHHVGSTSIPSMPSKDIIDIDIECPNGSIDRAIAVLAQAGYEHEGDCGVPTREAFSPRNDSKAFRQRPHHLYACQSDSPELRRHLAFRDYLMAHPERASWLANEKRRADELAVSRDAYIEGKVAAYEEIVALASSWSANQ